MFLRILKHLLIGLVNGSKLWVIFVTLLGYKNHEIKKMITTGMLKGQLWMTDDEEFDHVVKNLQRVFSLNDQYENIYMLKNLQKSVI